MKPLPKLPPSSVSLPISRPRYPVQEAVELVAEAAYGEYGSPQLLYRVWRRLLLSISLDLNGGGVGSLDLYRSDEGEERAQKGDSAARSFISRHSLKSVAMGVLKVEVAFPLEVCGDRVRKEELRLFMLSEVGHAMQEQEGWHDSQREKFVHLLEAGAQSGDLTVRDLGTGLEVKPPPGRCFNSLTRPEDVNLFLRNKGAHAGLAWLEAFNWKGEPTSDSPYDFIKRSGTAISTAAFEDARSPTGGLPSAEGNSPGLTKRERQIQAILAGLRDLGVPLMSIQTGVKAKLRLRLKGTHADLFGGGDSPFNDAWSEASKTGRLSVADKDKYVSRR